VTLNRPKALNALNAPMVAALLPVYRTLAAQSKVVIMKGTGGKAFCAGEY
jgi:enoyl-CoA hydratase/carnithine racemase